MCGGSKKERKMVEICGFEPQTPCLQSREQVIILKLGFRGLKRNHPYKIAGLLNYFKLLKITHT